MSSVGVGVGDGSGVGDALGDGDLVCAAVPSGVALGDGLSSGWPTHDANKTALARHPTIDRLSAFILAG